MTDLKKKLFFVFLNFLKVKNYAFFRKVTYLLQNCWPIEPPKSYFLNQKPSYTISIKKKWVRSLLYSSILNVSFCPIG